LIATGRFPVRRQRRVPSQEITLLKVAIDEILKEELVDVRPACLIGYRPNVICRNSQSPVTRLRQYNNGWTVADPIGAEDLQSLRAFFELLAELELANKAYSL
jgi:hypothetical protein